MDFQRKRSLKILRQNLRDNSYKKANSGSRNILEASRFYLRYLSLTGTFPVINIWRKKPIAFRWLSMKVAYTLGLLIYVFVQGYAKVKAVLVSSSGVFQHLETDDLVMLSVIIFTPIMSSICIVSMLMKASSLTSLIRNWLSHQQPSSYKKPVIIIVVSMIISLALLSMGQGPSVFSSRKKEVVPLVTMADVLFWFICAPSIMAPSVLFAYLTTSLGSSFEDLKKDCQKFNKMERRNEVKISTMEGLTIAKFQKRYNLLASMVKNVNQVFSPTILIVLIYYSVELCMYLYEVVVLLAFKNVVVITSKIVLILLFCSLFFYLLILPIEGAQTTQEQSEQCLEELSKCIVYVKGRKNFYGMLAFLIKFLTHPPQCHASSFVSINRPAFVAVLSGILTFIIILVQFKKSETT